MHSSSYSRIPSGGRVLKRPGSLKRHGSLQDVGTTGATVCQLMRPATMSHFSRGSGVFTARYERGAAGSKSAVPQIFSKWGRPRSWLRVPPTPGLKRHLYAA